MNIQSASTQRRVRSRRVATAAGIAIAGGTLTAGAALPLGPLAACAGIVVLTAVSALSANRSFDLVKKRGEVVAAALDSLLETQSVEPLRLDVAAMGALEETAESYNRVADLLFHSGSQNADLSDRLKRLPVEVAEALGDAEKSSGEQEAAVEETASLLANINTSILRERDSRQIAARQFKDSVRKEIDDFRNRFESLLSTSRRTHRLIKF